jgi:hypothetical protein
MSQKIEFQKMRGIAEIINATFEFTREHLKGLLKSVIFIAGPFILIGSLLFGYIMYGMTKYTQSMVQGGGPIDSPFSSMALEFFLVFVLLMAAFFLFYSVVYEYIDIYVKEKKATIETSEIWKAIRKDAWMFVKTILGMTLVFLVIFILFAVAASLVMMLAGAIGALTSPFVIFIFIIPLYAFLFYLVAPYALIFNVRINERKRFFDSVSQCHKLVSSNRMNTMAVLLLSIILQFMLSFVLNGPRFLIQYLNLNSATTMDLSWVTFVTVGIASIAGFAIGIISIVSINLQYFNLLERKQAPSLLNKIEGLGSTPTNTAAATNEETY